MTGKTVLICDDNDHYRATLQMSLEAFGLHVISAADAKSALSLARWKRPDLAIVDVYMPGEDGMELGRKLTLRHPGLPILVCSGNAPVFGSTTLTMGVPYVAGVFPKTIDLEDLKALVLDTIEDNHPSK